MNDNAAAQFNSAAYHLNSALDTFFNRAWSIMEDANLTYLDIEQMIQQDLGGDIADMWCNFWWENKDE